jgi:LacI family transcriptional regulator
MADSERIWRIVLLIEGKGEYQRGLIRGIHDYAGRRGHWVCRFCTPEAFRRGAIADWPWDGLLLQAEGPAKALARALRTERRPIVSLSDTRKLADWPCVTLDNIAVGTMAAEYLRTKPARTFAFAGCNLRSLEFAAVRRDAFRRALAEHDLRAHSLTYRASIQAQQSELPRIARWLCQAPKPIGVFVANDSWALDIVSLCAAHGLRVPDDVMLLGVDNDELLCELSHPPLSSIGVPTEQLGYRAAALLAGRLQGRRGKPDPLLMPPSHVVTRQSTETFHCPDPLVRDAQQLMQEQLTQRVNVKLVAQELRVSRRLLERRFVAAVGRTPHDELLRLRIGKARGMLQNSDKSLSSIAQLCGFRDASHFSLAYRRQTGRSPSAERRMSAPFPSSRG